MNQGVGQIYRRRLSQSTDAIEDSRVINATNNLDRDRLDIGARTAGA